MKRLAGWIVDGLAIGALWALTKWDDAQLRVREVDPWEVDSDD